MRPQAGKVAEIFNFDILIVTINELLLPIIPQKD